MALPSLATMASRLESKDIVIRGLKERLALAQEEVVFHKTEKQNAIHNLAHVQRKTNSLEQKVVGLNQHIKKLEQSLKAAALAAHEKDAKYMRIVQIGHRMLQTSMKRKADNNTLKHRLNASSRQSMLSKAALERLRQALEASQRENETLKKNGSDNADKEKKAADEEIKALKKTLSEATTHKLSATKFIKEKEGLEKKILDLTALVKATADAATADRHRAEKKADAELKAERTNVEGLCQKVATLEKEKLECFTAELQARQRCSDAEKLRQGLDRQVATMRTQLEHLEQEKTTLQNQVEFKQAALEKLENSNLAQENYEQKGKIHLLEARIRELEDEVDSIRMHHSERKKEIDALKTDMNDKQSEIDALKEEVKKLTPPADFGLGVDSQDSWDSAKSQPNVADKFFDSLSSSGEGSVSSLRL